MSKKSENWNKCCGKQVSVKFLAKVVIPTGCILYPGKITIAGKDGADAKRYQEKEVKQAIEEVEGKNQDDEA